MYSMCPLQTQFSQTLWELNWFNSRLYFIYAPSKAALSHWRPASTVMRCDIRDDQYTDKRNAMYIFISYLTENLMCFYHKENSVTVVRIVRSTWIHFMAKLYYYYYYYYSITYLFTYVLLTYLLQ